MKRGPQSAQSDPKAQGLLSELGPPSLHFPLLTWLPWHVSSQRKAPGGDGEGGGGLSSPPPPPNNILRFSPLAVAQASRSRYNAPLVPPLMGLTSTALPRCE